MSFDPQKPYNNLPLLPPPVELETKAILKKAISANKALAELKGAGQMIPDLFPARSDHRPAGSQAFFGNRKLHDRGVIWTYGHNVALKLIFLPIFS